MSTCPAIPKPHLVSFGKWTSAKWPSATGQKILDLKVRPLFVDTPLKEYNTGNPHELTDRLFVVRRAFRVNDALPYEISGNSRLVGSGSAEDGFSSTASPGMSPRSICPNTTPFYSTPSWNRDFVAYCGVSEDGKKLYAVVAQVGRRNPILKKDVREPAGADDPDSECPAPAWERSPMRVIFQPDSRQKLVFSIRGRVIDVVNDAEDSDE